MTGRCSTDFETRRVTVLGEHRYTVLGDLSMHGVTGAVTLEVETSAAVRNLRGLTRIGASGGGRLSRKAWGITWNTLLDSGGILVADEVRIILNAEALLPPTE